jgi:glycosyltransferase involved in cell wall biosynthesis
MHSIVIPAYNEEKRVGKTLADYSSYFDSRGVDYELVVVCDGCTDKTTDIVKKFAGSDSRVKLFEVDRRLGKGGGVYYGFSKCTGDTVGFSDADNAIKPEEYDKLLNTLNNGWDCAIASRREKDSITVIPNAKTSWILAMKVASRTFNFLVNSVFGIKTKDTQCGAKVMKRHVYESIRHELMVPGFEFDVELLWRIKEHGYKTKETGIRWVHDLDSKSSLKNSHKMFMSLLKRRLKG